VIWWPAALASASVVGLCAYRIFAGNPVKVQARPERVSASVLERTLSQLEQLDTTSYPAAVPPPNVAPPRPVDPLPQIDVKPSSGPSTPQSAAPDTGSLPLFTGRPPRLTEAFDPPRQPPVPSRAPFDDPMPDRPLPTRVPQRLSATTAPAAGLGSWAPAGAHSSTRSDMGPPPPPDGAIDPATGEPDPQAYRKWLRDWLDYVESQP
jgi:hippurate hydrolase